MERCRPPMARKRAHSGVPLVVQGGDWTTDEDDRILEVYSIYAGEEDDVWELAASIHSVEVAGYETAACRPRSAEEV